MFKHLKRIWTRLQGHSDFDLEKILFSEKGRDVFLDDYKIVSLHPDAITRDASRIVRYAETEDYQAFAKEVYQDVLYSIDNLTRDNLTGSETDFYRGRLAQALDVLKVSYAAHRKLQEKRETKKS